VFTSRTEGFVRSVVFFPRSFISHLKRILQHSLPPLVLVLVSFFRVEKELLHRCPQRESLRRPPRSRRRVRGDADRRVLARRHLRGVSVLGVVRQVDLQVGPALLVRLSLGRESHLLARRVLQKYFHGT